MDFTYLLMIIIFSWVCGFMGGFSVGISYILNSVKQAVVKRTTVKELNPNKWE